MKRTILSLIVVAFAFAVQAGDADKCQDKEKGACCASKVQTSLQTQVSQDQDKAEGSCCASKVKTSLEVQSNQGQDKAEGSCCASKVKTSVEAKGSCPFAQSASAKRGLAKQNGTKRVVLLSPKAASFASQ